MTSSSFYPHPIPYTSLSIEHLSNTHLQSINPLGISLSEALMIVLWGYSSLTQHFLKNVPAVEDSLVNKPATHTPGSLRFQKYSSFRSWH